jgi:hypothetical protein
MDEHGTQSRARLQPALNAKFKPSLHGRRCEELSDAAIPLFPTGTKRSFTE